MILESIKYLQPAVCSPHLRNTLICTQTLFGFWEQMVQSNKDLNTRRQELEHETQQRETSPMGSKCLYVLQIKNLKQHCCFSVRQILPATPLNSR